MSRSPSPSKEKRAEETKDKSLDGRKEDSIKEKEKEPASKPPVDEVSSLEARFAALKRK